MATIEKLQAQLKECEDTLQRVRAELDRRTEELNKAFDCWALSITGSPNNNPAKGTDHG